MKSRSSYILIFIIMITNACNTADGSPTDYPSLLPVDTITSLPATGTFTSVPTVTVTSMPLPIETMTATPSLAVESLKAKVTAGLLSCRYGPGPEYLYLFALRETAQITLVGHVNADNWNWVWVENETRCWVNAKFLEVEGDIRNLPVVYPGIAKLPVTPYYPPPAVLSAKRNQETSEVTVSWVHVPISPGDFEDETMPTYIVEVWRCIGGQLIFEPLATSLAFITFVDQPGCSEPSHGRVFVQEKHGYAGPAQIPWPEY